MTYQIKYSMIISFGEIMYAPTLCSLTQSKEQTLLALDYSIINSEYSVDYEGIIGLYVCKTQLSIFIETKESIKGYTINPNKNKIGQWRTTTLPRNSEHTNEFKLLRNTSENYIEVNERLVNLEFFREMLNQETHVGFSNIKDINKTVQLALSVLNSIIDFQYNPELPLHYL